MSRELDLVLVVGGSLRFQLILIYSRSKKTLKRKVSVFACTKHSMGFGVDRSTAPTLKQVAWMTGLCDERRIIERSETKEGAASMYQPRRLGKAIPQKEGASKHTPYSKYPLCSEYHVDPPLKTEVFTMENQVFPNIP